MACVVRDAGFQCSLTTEAELPRVDGDRFDWGRFQVDQGDSPAVICGKLSGWYGWLRSSGQAALRLLRRGFESRPAAAPLQLGRFR
jgi:hypothetical protein